MPLLPASLADGCCCCLPAVPRAPALVWNRPGLERIGFRLGTFATFRQALLDAIANEPSLAALTTRESDDHAITLLELFAAVGDVLSFYNERIAHELYLRTAGERDSVLRLVRLIGYELDPGLAATAMLAFTLDAGARTRLRKGLKVMSIPGQEERAQTYETLEEIIADATLNELPISSPPVLVNALAPGADGGSLIGRPKVLSTGDRLVLFGASVLEEKTLAELRVGTGGERLRFEPAVQAATLSPLVARAARIERGLRFFGWNAPDRYQVYDTDPSIPATQRWRMAAIDPSLPASLDTYPLDARYENLKPGAQLLIDAGPEESPRLRTAVVTETTEAPAALGLSLASTQLGPPAETVTHVRLRQTIRGMPAAAALGVSYHVAARNGAGHMLAFGPGFWTSRDVAASSDPSLVVASPARMDLFVRDGALRLSHAIWVAGAWGSFTDLGGGLSSRPVGISLATGEVLVFARGLDLGLWVKGILPAATAWLPLGGGLGSEPVPVSRGDDGIDLFVRGVDRGLWHRHRAGGAWSDWSPLKGVLASTPAAAATAANDLDVVALDDRGALLHRRWEGSNWTPWADLGGEGVGVPVIAATGAGRVEVFVRARDGVLKQIVRTGPNWSPWTSLGGALGSDPVVVAAAGGALQIYARDGDGALARLSRTAGVWQPWARLDAGLGAIADRRRARIYELASRDIEFALTDFPLQIGGGRIAARLNGAAPAELAKGRRILIEKGSVKHLAKVTAATAMATEPGAAPDHLVIDFTPALLRPIEDAMLKGNIAEASHGETQPDEALGNADATKAFQRFVLQRAPVTHLPSTMSMTPKSALEIRVNGELWQAVPSLYGRGPTDRIYTARRSDAGETIVNFGDGRTGARLPTGPANVVARYRKGLGRDGRMRADQLAIALERPVGLRSVTNPIASDGGADPESRDDARGSAPTTVRTFGRAVSLQDFEWIATTSGLVARAEVTWVWHTLERAVHLTVAGAEGDRLSPASLQKLHLALASARDPNRQLFLANLVRVPVVVSAKIVRDPALESDTVLAAAREALLSMFAFAAMPLGQAVHASGVYAALQGARGVVAVDLDLFHLKGQADLSATERAARSVDATPVQPHIRIFPARPRSKNPALIDRFARAGFEGAPPAVLAAEQAFIADPATDVALTLVEAL